HQEVRQLSGHVGGRVYRIADFEHVPARCKFIAFAPQWDFLDFLTRHARRLPGFRLVMNAEATDLLEEGGRVGGVRAKTSDGELLVRADLVVGADGRQSTVRARAGLEVEDLGAPIDVLWMRLPRRPGDPAQAFGFVDAG